MPPSSPDLPARAASPRPLVVIVGGGFSGVLTAIHLALDPDGPRIRLVERRPVLARGAAYATSDPGHMLNVRTANMSAFPDDPSHFRRWLARQAGRCGDTDFVSRSVYGDYLQDLLREAVRTTAPGRLLLDVDEIVDAAQASEGWRLTTRMGRSLEAQALILATGNLPPAWPPEATAGLLASPRFIGDPWSAEDRLRGLGARVLLLGSGLTMVDVALNLAGQGRRLLALSRHGLLPLAHAPAAATTPADQVFGTARETLRRVRERAGGGDWRAVIDGLRPHVQDIWSGWSPTEQGRFLRHLRPRWEIHRHRLAPGVARQLSAMLASGELSMAAGRPQALSLSDEEVSVTWRPRGRTGLVRQTMDAVVNCTGPLTDLARTTEPLLRQLLARGLLRQDRWALGADVDPAARPLDRRGAPTAGLYAVGPLTRGQFWEITSIPDIRVQARDVGAAVASFLRTI